MLLQIYENLNYPNGIDDQIRKKEKSKGGMIEFWEIDLGVKSIDTETQISPQSPIHQANI